MKLSKFPVSKLDWEQDHGRKSDILTEHWLRWPSADHDGEVSVIGDGIAGACLARQLSERGFKVSLYGNQQGSSHKIPQLLIRAYPEKAASPSHRLYQQAFEQAHEFYTRYCPEHFRTLTLATPEGPQRAAYLDAALAVAALRQHKNIEYHQLQIHDIQQGADGVWQLEDERGQAHQCRTLLLCTASVPTGLKLTLPSSPCAGQVIHIDTKLKQGFADSIHALPLDQGTQIGSSYRPGENDIGTRSAESVALLQSASQRCEDISADAAILASYAANRSTSADHLPFVGPAPDLELWAKTQQRNENQRSAAKKPKAPLLPGLWLNLTHGSRGGTMAPLAALLLSAALQDRPLPLERDLLDAVHPGRFATRETRRAATLKN